MLEVSCRAFQFFETEAPRAGIDLEALFEGTGLRLGDLRNPEGRVDWDPWAIACDRYMEQAGGPQAMYAAGARVVQLRIAERFARSAALGAEWNLPFRAADLLGRGPAGIATAVPTLDPEVLREGMQKVTLTADTGEPTHLEFPLRLGEDLRHVEVKMIRSSEGDVLAVVRDATLRKRLDAQLAMADRLASLGTLAAGVAHEINNPLTYVLANLREIRQALEMGSGPGASRLDELAALAEEAETGANRVRQIVSDLRTFSPSSRDDDRDAVDVEKVLDAMTSMAWNEIRHRATLERDYAGVPPVAASEARLGQVFLNLLVNAAQAIPEGSAQTQRIRLRTRTSGDRVVIEVSDTGIGIPKEQLSRIFDPFFTTKSRELGTGLGLAICHEMLQRYGGDIVASSEPGVGSTFRITLPSMGDGLTLNAPPRTATQRPPRGGPARLLVIDDDPAVARALSRLLRSHEVCIARDGFEALEILDADSAFQAILCDLMMPAMSGEEFYERLRDRWPNLAARFAFVTGGAFTERAQDFVRQTDVPILQKPLDPSLLRKVVDDLLLD